jgi:hypothetical protein
MEDARQVLVTLAPVVGTARIVSASSKISQALGFALDIADLLEDDAEFAASSHGADFDD